MDVLRFDDSASELSPARVYLELLTRERGKLSLDECRALFAEINRYVIPYRDGYNEEQDGILALFILLDGNIGSKGPLDSIKAFVLEFGSAQAKAEFMNYKPHEVYARHASPPKKQETPVSFESVRDYLKQVLKSWFGLTSQ